MIDSFVCPFVRFLFQFGLQFVRNGCEMSNEIELKCLNHGAKVLHEIKQPKKLTTHSSSSCSNAFYFDFFFSLSRFNRISLIWWIHQTLKVALDFMIGRSDWIHRYCCNHDHLLLKPKSDRTQITSKSIQIQYGLCFRSFPRQLWFHCNAVAFFVQPFRKSLCFQKQRNCFNQAIDLSIVGRNQWIQTTIKRSKLRTRISLKLINSHSIPFHKIYKNAHAKLLRCEHHFVRQY